MCVPCVTSDAYHAITSHSLTSPLSPSLPPSLPGPDTIHELRHSLLLADLERSGGIGVHASPLAEVSDVGNVLQKAGFALPATGLSP